MVNRVSFPTQILTLCAMFLLPTPTLADSSVNRLVSLLVAKGMLTAEEAEEVMGEMQQLSSKPVAVRREGKRDRVRMSGDLRLRYQWEDTSNLPPQSRIPEEAGAARFQGRFGVDVDLDESWSVGVGVASGGDNPRSTNQTFSNGFPSYDARIDYAYARYDYRQQASVLVGKFKNPVYTSANLLWDSDIRPEGIMGIYQPGGRGDIRLQGGVLVLNDKEKDIQEDAFMYLLQAHWRWNADNGTRLDIAPAYYFSSDLQGTPGLTDHAIPTNSRDSAGNLLYTYDAATVSAKLSWAPGALVDHLELFGEYVYAPDPDNDNVGWLLGVTAGDSSLNRSGDWRFEYNYRRLEQNAWPEFLQDSDFLFGATAVKGHNLILEMAITPDISLGLEYYLHGKVIGTDIDQDLLQLDLNLAF